MCVAARGRITVQFGEEEEEGQQRITECLWGDSELSPLRGSRPGGAHTSIKQTRDDDADDDDAAGVDLKPKAQGR